MIETTFIRLEAAAVELDVTPDTLWDAAQENLLRLWAPLHEWRDYDVYDYSLSRDEHGVLCEGRGREYFDFVPLFGVHVASLLKQGKAVSEVLSEVDQIVKEIPEDEPQKITITRGDPLYVLAEDIARMKAAKALPEAVTGTAQRDIDPREERTYHNIIAGLLDLMLSKSPGGQAGSPYKSQGAIIDALLAHCGEGRKPGIAKRTLEEKFAAAKRTFEAS